MQFCGAASLKSLSKKIISLFRFLFSNGRSQIRGDFSPELTTTSSVCLNCPFSPFRFDLVSEMMMMSEIREGALSSSANNGIDICSNVELYDLTYEDDVTLVSLGLHKLPGFLDHSNNSVGMLCTLKG